MDFMAKREDLKENKFWTAASGISRQYLCVQMEFYKEKIACNQPQGIIVKYNLHKK